MKKILQILTTVASFAVIATVLPSGQTVFVPQQAVDHSPALESVTYVHYLDGSVKPVKPVSPARPGVKTTCYAYLSAGAKLVAVENLLVNPAGSGMLETDLLNQTFVSAMEWDNHISKTLWGTVSLDYAANFDSSPDGLNEISFGPYGDPKVIAVTRVWGIFSGKTKYIDQFDVMFNTAYSWGDVVATGNTGLMDYADIGTHELGHGVGLSDLYNTCTDETMYGYSNYGEIKKRDLNSGDILGLTKLYGA